jgi:hypothetical protein
MFAFEVSMESVQTITSSVGVQPTIVARPAPATVVEAVPTDLSPANTVTAANTTATPNNNVQTDPNEYQDTVLIDPATREVVLRVLAARTGQVVRQIPDQAMLRMQAYAQALDSGKTMSQALAATDFEA